MAIAHPQPVAQLSLKGKPSNPKILKLQIHQPKSKVSEPWCMDYHNLILYYSYVLMVINPKIKFQGPVVQSIISLTSSLRGLLIKFFMTL